MADDDAYPTAASLPFPFPPYPQQLELMDCLLQGLRKPHNVLFLESPTGTGKSLSLATASLAWLRYMERQDRKAKAPTKSSSPTSGLDWLDDWVSPDDRQAEEDAQCARDQAVEAREKLESELRKLRGRNRVQQLQMAVTEAKQQQRKKRPREEVTAPPPSDLLDPCYDSDRAPVDEDATFQRKGPLSMHGKLLHGAYLDGSALGGPALGNVAPGAGVRKILYAARTHSQLSQFVSEVHRIDPTLRVIALGGRGVLCGNPSLQSKSEAARNDACLDMKESSCKCPLKSATETLALHLLTQPTDVEEAAELGKAAHTCAYYGSRQAVAAAQVVVVPYSILFSASTREAVGVSLKESLVIVDEAHNVPEALRAIHSCHLSLPMVEGSLHQLGAYVERYQSRLAGRHLFYLGQLRKVLLAFSKHLKKEETAAELQSPTAFLLDLKLGQVNLFKITRYLEKSRLAQKLRGFQPEETVLSKHVSAMSYTQTFLEKLSLTAGKVVTEKKELRYVLLDPAVCVKDLWKEAHGVALVGGTLRPFAHVATELLGDPATIEEARQADLENRRNEHQASVKTESEHLTTFTCGHVVDPSNVLLQCYTRGPSGSPLDLRFSTRSNDTTLDEVGRTILELCRHIPCGVVVFLPSYSYEATLVRRWKATGLWTELAQLKKLHREPTSSKTVDVSLSAYAFDATQGALLLSVMGGKLSEGINFANDMARGVLVVGLPYADPNDPVLREKMAGNNQEYYQTLCLRSVNQSVGRAIRHAKDYAVIGLLDGRYTQKRIWKDLPGWLRQSGNPKKTDWKEHLQDIGSFFSRTRPHND